MGNYKLQQIKVRDKTSDYYIYSIEPSTKIIIDYLTNRIAQQPFTIQYVLMSKYNFTAEEYYKYLISKFHAIVKIIPKFPFFQVYFSSIQDGQRFIAELEERTEK